MTNPLDEIAAANQAPGRKNPIAIAAQANTNKPTNPNTARFATAYFYSLGFFAAALTTVVAANILFWLMSFIACGAFAKMFGR